MFDVKCRAFISRIPVESWRLCCAVRSRHIDRKGSILLMVLDTLPGLVAGEVFHHTQGPDGLLCRRIDIDGPKRIASQRPCSAVFPAPTLIHHVFFRDDTSAWQFIHLELRIVLWFVVTIGKAGGEGDAFAVSVVVYHENQCAWHIIGAEADSAPGEVAVDAQCEIKVIVLVFRDRKGE